MATAEKLLNEAQYAFQNIGFGDSADGRKHRARAKSMAQKVMRKYPETSEAAMAHSILLRLGDAAYIPVARTKNVHTSSSSPESQHSHFKTRTPIARTNADYQSASNSTSNSNSNTEELRWGALIEKLLSLPKWAIGFLFMGGLFLFGLFGPFLLLPIIALAIFGSPLKRIFPQKSRRDSDEVIRKINTWLLEEKKSNSSRQ